MDPMIRDDMIYTIQQTQMFYGKELDELQIKLWLRALGHCTLEEVKRACSDYTAEGRYAPKPVDIIERVKRHRDNRRGALPPPAEPTQSSCPPEIAAAWAWYVRLRMSGGIGTGFGGKAPDIDPELQERYLHIVNHEAKRLGAPDSLEDEHKLQEVWG
jgi:hypothetical protein